MLQKEDMPRRGLGVRAEQSWAFPVYDSTCQCMAVHKNARLNMATKAEI